MCSSVGTEVSSVFGDDICGVRCQSMFKDARSKVSNCYDLIWYQSNKNKWYCEMKSLEKRKSRGKYHLQ